MMNGQSAIWAGIRALKTFTHAEISEQTGVNASTIRAYVRRLTIGGYLEILAPKPKNQPRRWNLIKNTGVEAPRLNSNGQPVTHGRMRENLWRTIKILNEFDYRELAAAASTDDVLISAATAQDYCKHLKKAGYLHSSQRQGLARYRLIPSRNTGPQPPQIQRTKQIFDPNLGQVVWSSNQEAV